MRIDNRKNKRGNYNSRMPIVNYKFNWKIKQQKNQGLYCISTLNQFIVLYVLDLYFIIILMIVVAIVACVCECHHSVTNQLIWIAYHSILCSLSQIFHFVSDWISLIRITCHFYLWKCSKKNHTHTVLDYIVCVCNWIVMNEIFHLFFRQVKF